MSKKITYALSLLALLFILPACQQQSDVEEATLDLSTQTLTFAKEASEQTITVQTNKDSWSAVSPQEATWLTLTLEGNTLKVRAEANDLGRDRLGAIVVNAGGLQKRVTVRQSAADVILNMDLDRVSFPIEGGTKKVVFESNTSVKVELAADAPWLTLSDVTKSSFTLAAERNEGETSRSVKITITAGTQVKELEVVQDGANQYILPLQQFPANLVEVIRFERSRQGELIRSFQRGSAALFRFTTQNKIFPLIEYEFEHERSKGFQAAMQLCLDDKFVKNNPTFVAYLQACGYQKSDKLSNEGQDVYEHNTLPLNLNVAFDSSGEALLETVYQPRQPRAYKTFDHLPMKQLLAMNSDRSRQIHGYKKEEVAKKEQEWKGELDVKDPRANRADYQRYIAKGSLDGESHRGYFFVQPSEDIPADDPFVDEVFTTQAIFADVTLGFWTDALGRSYVTQEMNKLLADNGYTFLRELNGGFMAYYNGAEKAAYILHAAQLNGKPILEIQTFLVDLPVGNGIRTQQAGEKLNLLDRRARIIEAISGRLQRFPQLQSRR
ncbi:BACON domain-containing protein [uncultured Porphyromonas sp.]|uniref:BACON domain-containing protein n=1 Tax=uncultured Porphyromonas sp. TaxID=159274 RepID=UPI002629E866|nr:BACON domain-containing protein [uncultured Porphyromonas sp.]